MKFNDAALGAALFNGNGIFDGNVLTTAVIASLHAFIFVSVSVMMIGMKKKIIVSESKEENVRLALLILAGGVFSVMICLRYGPGIESLKGIVLVGILSVASYSDLLTHTADNYLTVMILITGLIEYDSTKMLKGIIGASLILLFLLTVASFSKNGSIGGADIKISAACGMILGLEKGLLALLTGLLTGVATMLLLSANGKHGRDKPFPLVPFLAVGALAMYLV